jgi:hypothetical protein
MEDNDKPPAVYAGGRDILVTLIAGILGWVGFFVFVGLLAWIAYGMWEAM